MSNVKHNKCPIRTLANEAKARLSNGDYNRGCPPIPKNATPQQRDIYVKLFELKRGGKCIENPIATFADENKLASLSHAERQRYILQISADYVSMRAALEAVIAET